MQESSVKECNWHATPTTTLHQNKFMFYTIDDAIGVSQLHYNHQNQKQQRHNGTRA
jgi:hypothetical protein